jgi:uncharacterized protein YndB with AHSA1/START domain
MTITAEFDAPVERAWKLWDDPRQLERWWGPPTYPATFVEHDLRPGGTVTYFMTGPEGDTSRGWWRIISADPPRSLVFEDGFAGEDGKPNPDMPVVTGSVQLDGIPGGRTRMTLSSKFPSLEAMEQLVSMGMEEGIRLAIGQIDAILAETVPAR